MARTGLDASTTPKAGWSATTASEAGTGSDGASTTLGTGTESEPQVRDGNGIRSLWAGDQNRIRSLQAGDRMGLEPWQWQRLKGWLRSRSRAWQLRKKG